MAHFKPGILGSPNGKIGNIIFRKRNSKTHVYSHCGTNKISDSPDCVNNRSAFSVAVKFSSAVNSVSSLKPFWINSKFKGENSYTKILKHNIKSFHNKQISNLTEISPPGFSFSCLNFRISNNHISSDIKVSNISPDYIGKSFNLIFLFQLLNPISPDFIYKTPFFAVEFSFLLPSLEQYFNINFPLKHIQSGIISNFSNAIILSAVTHISKENSINSSSFFIPEIVRVK